MAPRPPASVPAPAARQQATAHLTARVPQAAPDDRAGEVLRGLAGGSFDCADDIVVLEDGELVGLVPIERLFAAPPAAALREIMDADPPVVTPGCDQQAVAWKMVRRGESSVAVVDDERRFLGLVPPHRLVGALLAEHDEDMARIGGYLSRASEARQAAEERLLRRLWHRVPWLALGLLGAMVSAVLVSAFEDDLEANVLLAVFVPAVVYMADAVGTQTEALLIRGLSAGVDLRLVARRECASGMVIGSLLASFFLPFVWIAWGEASVAIAVALALFAACAMATMIAMLLPWLLYRSGRDPAFGSGPMATVIQDLLSILTYFAVASVLVT